MTRQQEIWESVTRPKFPNATGSQLSEMKMQAALQWGMDSGDWMADLYDQYVMLKKLMDVGWAD